MEQGPTWNERRVPPWDFPWPDEFAAIEAQLAATRRRIDALIADLEKRRAERSESA
jgi:hypothetical protein